MIVRLPRLTSTSNHVRIEAVVESESEKFAPFHWYVGVPAGLAPWLDLSGNSFIPGLLLLAGVLQERLLIEAPVSPLLAQNANRALALYRQWWNTAPVDIQADISTSMPPPGGRAALLFTRGIDSWFSAMRAAADNELASHLIYSPDLDRHYSPALRERALHLTREAAETVGHPLVAVATNARDLLDRFMTWEWSHGGVLAAIGLSLGHQLRTFTIASTFDVNHLIPWGSHVELDLLWSTERTAIRHDGAEATRTQKIAFLARFPEVLDRIKVCWCADIDRNCGTCEKCVRTQCALAAAGVLDQCRVFDAPLSADRIRALPNLPHAFWSDLQERMTCKPELAEHSAVVATKLKSQKSTANLDSAHAARHRPLRKFARATHRMWRVMARRLRPEPKEPRILLVSSAGVRNHGDDAILLATLDRLQRVRPGTNVTIVSDGNDIPPYLGHATWAGNACDFCRGLNSAEIRRGIGDRGLAGRLIERVQAGAAAPRKGSALSNFDVVLFAGGGNLTTHFPDIVAWRTAIAAAARGSRVPYILSGQGVGPISEGIAPMLSFLTANAQSFGTRDPLSAELITRLGRRACDVSCVGDDALGITPADDSVVDYYLEACGLPVHRPLLGFHAREARDYGNFDRAHLVELARFVDRLAAEHGYGVAGLPINSQTWAPEAELLAHLARCEPRRAPWHIVDCGQSVRALAGVIGRCRAVVTLSYHVALFALQCGIPTRMAVRTEYYQRKAEGLRRFFEMPDEITLQDQLDTSWVSGRAAPPHTPAMASVAIDKWLDATLPRLGSLPGKRAA